VKRKLLLCLIAVATQGCVIHLAPDESDPVPLKYALAVVDRDLRNTSPATLGDVESVDGKAKIVAAIKVARCADDSENPLEPVITGAISVALQGSISKAKGGTGTVSATPSLAYAYTVTKGQQQQVTVPITFVPLKTLPDFYLGQNLANFNGISDKDKKSFVDELLRKRHLLQDLIAKLAAYNKGECSDEEKNPIVPYSLRLQ
jgi:hypothetical protein